MRDMLLGGPHLVKGSCHKEGVTFQQNGEWDDTFLCHAHEQLIGSGDDYGVRFCRHWQKNASVRPSGSAIEIPNTKPEALLHFAYAVIWRHALSNRNIGPELGPYEQLILNALLNRGPYELKLLIGTNPLTIGGQSANVAVGPFKIRLADRNVIQFTVSGLDFYLKADRQSFPAGWDQFLANDNKIVAASLLAPLPFQEVRKFRPIFRQMGKAPGRS